MKWVLKLCVSFHENLLCKKCFYKMSDRQLCRLLSIWLLPLAFKLLHTWHCIFGGILLYILYNIARVELNFVTILKRIFNFEFLIWIKMPNSNSNQFVLGWKSTVRKLNWRSEPCQEIPCPPRRKKLDCWRTGFLIFPSNLDFWQSAYIG